MMSINATPALGHLSHVIFADSLENATRFAEWNGWGAMKVRTYEDVFGPMTHVRDEGQLGLRNDKLGMIKRLGDRIHDAITEDTVIVLVMDAGEVAMYDTVTDLKNDYQRIKCSHALMELICHLRASADFGNIMFMNSSLTVFTGRSERAKVLRHDHRLVIKTDLSNPECVSRW